MISYIKSTGISQGRIQFIRKTIPGHDRPTQTHHWGAKMEMRERNRSTQQILKRHRARRGFTLLELLVAIVVITILAAFILPAVTGVFGTAKESSVRNEISQLESAIATFKQKYGIEPPSYIKLYESPDTGDDMTSADPSWRKDTTADEMTYPHRVASRALIQRMWPNFDFSIARDLDHDGNTTDYYILRGSDCLVFFLGGMLQFGPGTDGQPGVAGTDDDGANGADDAAELGFLGSDDTAVLAGFSKNPANPFATPTNGEVREGPFFEFTTSRLRKSGIMTAPAPADFLRYLDPLGGQTSPYLYLSSYDGTGYHTADIPASTNLSGPFLTASGGPAQKQKNSQIISPGADSLYSLSGGSVIYDISQSNNGLGTNNAAYDNITNFSNGRLKP